MIILVFTLLAWLILRKHAQKPQRRTRGAALIPVYAEPVITPAEIQRRERARREAEREQERQRKAEEARRQAKQDIDHLEVMREQYMTLYDLIEQERDAADTTAKRRAQLQRQLITLEEKLYSVERRKNKAYYILQEA